MLSDIFCQSSLQSSILYTSLYPITVSVLSWKTVQVYPLFRAGHLRVQRENGVPSEAQEISLSNYLPRN